MSINEAIATLAPEWQLDAIENIEFLAGGYSNSNYSVRYAGREYVVRVPGRVQPFVDRAHEQAWLENLPLNIGAEVIAFDRQTGAMLSRWVEGTLLVDWWGSLQPSQEPSLLVSFLVDLHSQLPDAGRIYDLEALVDAYGVSEFRPLLANGSVTTCHNDLNPWNIIVTEDGWTTLDWEFVGNNDPIFDLVSLHQGLELPEDELLDLVRLYMHTREPELDADPKARLAACLHNYWLREYGWAVDQLARGSEREEVKDQRSMALKKLRA